MARNEQIMSNVSTFGYKQRDRETGKEFMHKSSRVLLEGLYKNSIRMKPKKTEIITYSSYNFICSIYLSTLEYFFPDLCDKMQYLKAKL